MHTQLQRYDPQIVLESTRTDRSADKFEPFGSDGITFSDILDLVNPLQHIPIVGSLYRKITGDSIDPAMRVAGGALFGGPLGVVVSMASLAVAAIVKPHATNSVPPTTSVADQLPAVKAHRTQALELETQAPMSLARQPQPQPLADVGRSEPSRALERSVSNEVRRGGWMIAYAHGEMSNDKERRDDLDPQSINITI